MIGIETQYKLKDYFQTVAEQEIIVERQIRWIKKVGIECNRHAQG